MLKNLWSTLESNRAIIDAYIIKSLEPQVSSYELNYSNQEARFPFPNYDEEIEPSSVVEESSVIIIEL